MVVERQWRLNFPETACGKVHEENKRHWPIGSWDERESLHALPSHSPPAPRLATPWWYIVYIKLATSHQVCIYNVVVSQHCDSCKKFSQPTKPYIVVISSQRTRLYYSVQYVHCTYIHTSISATSAHDKGQKLQALLVLFSSATRLDCGVVPLPADGQPNSSNGLPLAFEAAFEASLN